MNFRLLASALCFALVSCGGAGTEPAETEEKADLSTFPQSVEQMSQTQINAIFKFKYSELSEADQQLWIDVYANQFKVGFDKRRAVSVMQSAEMTRNIGDASDDTVYVTIKGLFSADDDTVDYLAAQQCRDRALVWAMDNGLTLNQRYEDVDGGLVIENVINTALCSSIMAK